MALEIGIVGLPNAGKSTLFNALVNRRLAETAPHPFTTIDPHEAVVVVPDEKLNRLSALIKPQETVPATVTFIDIAGLVKGAHQGEGLGNQFLAKIREVDAILHVVGAYQKKSEQEIVDEIEIVNLELELGGITDKPVIYVVNHSHSTPKVNVPGIVLNLDAKTEEDLIDFSQSEKDELGLSQSGLERLIKEAYRLLNLLTFYTIKGGKEVHAWSLPQGSSVLTAAAEVHTDFARNFVKAEVILVDELLSIGGWKAAKEKGKLKLEGKDYLVNNGEVIEFKVGSG